MTQITAKEHKMDINHLFANHSDEEDIYPPTVSEIAEEQRNDAALQKQNKTCNYEETLVKDILVLCKKGKLVIPRIIQHKIVAW